jgi:hypothetical protein
MISAPTPICALVGAEIIRDILPRKSIALAKRSYRYKTGLKSGFQQGTPGGERITFMYYSHMTGQPNT